MKQLILALTLAATLVGCGKMPDPAQTLASAQALEVSAASVPEPGLLCAGQLTTAQMDALVEQGFKTFVTLRGEEEEGAGEDATHLAGLGATFKRFQISGAEGITEENARQLDAMLNELDRPLVLYCGSSNRVGALYGARAYFVQGAGREDALAQAKAAGMTRLEGRLQELLAE